jgi:aryl-phospho-beta-D-glucosidase BglC (GH1 family)
MKSATILGCMGFLPSVALAWLPEGKVRGVNLGGLFIIEPWMMGDEWSAMGCSDQKSEFDCVMALGQDAADQAFQKHWDTWITEDDIAQIASLGLNTIRIPIGYWMKEDLIDSSEHFPRGGFQYLERVCGWANDQGLYVILDLHGAPGAQEPEQPFTGQYAPDVGFFDDYNYGRAYEWLEYMTNASHTNPSFASVGAIELVNEPLQDAGRVSSMISTFYPTSYNRIRAVEDGLGVSSGDRLHIQMMDALWGSGDPTSSLPSDAVDTLYDDHNYVKWTPDVDISRDGYMQFSCTNSRGGNSPVIVGEWSLSVADGSEWNDEFTLDAPDAAEWYNKWWSAQVMGYEKEQGWIFWTWKVQWIGGRNEWRWGYQQVSTYNFDFLSLFPLLFRY